MHRYRNALGETITEIVPLQQPCHRIFAAQFHHVLECHPREPFAVVPNLGLIRIQNLEHLRLVSLGIGFDLRHCQRWTRRIPPARIPDSSCRRRPDQKNHLVPQVLEVLHLPQQHRMPKVQIRRSGIEPRLHAQRPPLLFAQQNALPQIFLANQFGEAFTQISKLFVDGYGH